MDFLTLDTGAQSGTRTHMNFFKGFWNLHVYHSIIWANSVGYFLWPSPPTGSSTHPVDRACFQNCFRKLFWNNSVLKILAFISPILTTLLLREWCGWWDLNPYECTHYHLKVACLPFHHLGNWGCKYNIFLIKIDFWGDILWKRLPVMLLCG